MPRWAACLQCPFPVQPGLRKRNRKRNQAVAGTSHGMGDRVALLKRTFGEEVKCPDCGGKLRLIALVKKEETIQALLKAMHMQTEATGPPERAQAEPATTEPLELEWSGQGERADWPEYPD